MQFVDPALVTCHINVIHSRHDGQFAKLYRVLHLRLCQPAFLLNPVIRLFCLLILCKHLTEQPQMIVDANAVPV